MGGGAAVPGGPAGDPVVGPRPDPEDDRALRALVADMADCVTRKAVPELARLLTPDATWEVAGYGAWSGHHDIIAWLGGLLDQWESIVHCVHSGLLAAGDRPDEAHGRWIVSEFGTKGGVEVRFAGVYHERYRRDADGWRFAHRRFQGMFTRIGGEVAVRPYA